MDIPKKQPLFSQSAAPPMTGCQSACCSAAIETADPPTDSCTPLGPEEMMESCADATDGQDRIESSTTAVSTASACCSGCDDQPTTVSKPELTYAPGIEDLSCSDHGAGGSSKKELACCSDEGSCNDIKGKAAVNDTIPITAKGCQDACCDSSEEDNVCDQPVPSSELACQDQCCALDSPADGTPSCCEGKPTPCCDETCIDRLVSRERIAGTKRTIATSTSSKSSASIREEYSIRLAALGCLCRALIALGQESCCSTKQASYASRKKSSAARKKSSEKVSAARNQSCCASSTCKASGAREACPEGVRKRTETQCSSRQTSTSKRSRSPACTKGCCGSLQTEAASKPVKPVKLSKPDCKDACCSTVSDGEALTIASDLPDPDLEMGANVEHVVLGISGMTCTGCETKLQATLGKLPAISNLKSSLVLGRVEFNLKGTSVPNIIKHIERTTEFKCDVLAADGSSIDVLPSQGAKDFLKQSPPDGVREMSMIDEQTVRIVFDPKVIGARDITERGFDAQLPLAPLQKDPALAAGGKHVRYLGLMTLLSAVLTIPVLVLAYAPLPERPIIYGSISLALATIIQVVIAGPFYPIAIKSLIFSGVIEMDLLIVLSTSAAYIFSVVAFGYLVHGNELSSGEFFETGTLLVTLIMVGRWVSALARQKAVESFSIQSLQTSSALLISPASDGTETEIDTRLLQYGDVFKVMPDSQVPTDGVVLSGISESDESMLTGESRPIEKVAGSTVIGGSLNGSGVLMVRLTKLPCENTISTIANMVDAAKLSKPKLQGLADRVASYFVPTILGLTLIVFVAWVAVGIRSEGKSASDSVVQAVTYAITVLIVSCPCAIGLAVPMVVVIAGGVSADKGVVFKSAEAIENAYKTKHVVFDKTGTLTEGKMSVVVERYCVEDQQAAASTALGLLANIKHPVSMAVAAYLKERDVTPYEISDVKVLPGKGVEGYINGAHLRAGNSRWLAMTDHPSVQTILADGLTAFCFTIDSELRAVFGLTDQLRADSAFVVAGLKKRNISVSILSGDDDMAVRAVASTLGIDRENVRSRCSPADKQAYIQKLLEHDGGKKGNPVVVFVGDGTNDAVALTQATIGVHINSGTDVAQSAADVVLMRPSLETVITMVDISRASVRRILFNFGWSFVYNVFSILLAAGAFASSPQMRNVKIPPEFAGLGELVSVLPVIVVGVSMRWVKF